jgi:dihydrodipicolinate synthase/N-acetylneuraminate lyase
VDRVSLKKLIVGPIATVTTPFDDRFAVDYGRMAAATEYWVASGLVSGVSVLKVAAAMGEGPMLSDDEASLLLRTVVRAAKGKAAIVCGIHYKDTLRTIEDAKRAQDLGAIGVQVSPPIFSHPTQDDILRHYSAVSAAIDIGIVVYNTWFMWGGNILPETFHKMADLEHVAAIKWSVPDPAIYDEMASLAPIFNILDNYNQPVSCHRMGGRGYINTTVEIYPPHDLKVWELLENHLYEQAQVLFDRVNKPLRQFDKQLTARSGGEARLKKALTALMGHPMGVSRPPSLPLNAEEMAELRAIVAGFGWPVVG